MTALCQQTCELGCSRFPGSGSVSFVAGVKPLVDGGTLLSNRRSSECFREAVG